MSFGRKSNGAAMPAHKVEHVKRPAPGEPRAQGPHRQGPKSLCLPARAPVTLAEIPSLARDLALTHEDEVFMQAVKTAIEAMIEGPLDAPAEARSASPAPRVNLETFRPFTIEEEGALVRAFGLPRRADA
ncbi:MAG: hypothetical protein U0942_16015 [Parvibaculum sp.]|uniref:hypothetical protein n=1 Tax=Parvibaculum sp. TaxID=2024848 RepID=UPI002ABA2A40|nr:hypothetical protein [Parvibaculum sp.]MDZ4382838.1 hypothetical protein [Parvibaculum sp.]